jgi:hypothetical protein
VIRLTKKQNKKKVEKPKVNDKGRMPYNMWILVLAICILAAFAAIEFGLYLVVDGMDETKSEIVGYDKFVSDLTIEYKEDTEHKVEVTGTFDRTDLKCGSGLCMYETKLVNETRTINPTEFAEIKLSPSHRICNSFSDCMRGRGITKLEESQDKYFSIKTEKNMSIMYARLIIILVMLFVLLSGVATTCEFIENRWWTK